MNETLNTNPGETTTENKSEFAAAFEGYPPYEEHMQQMGEQSEASKHETTHYLEDIDDARRDELIGISAELSTAIPEAVIMGGNALRILYEAKTGNRMFGVGKNDHDIYVPRANLQGYINDGQIGGFPLDMERDEAGELRWIKPADGNLVINPPDGHDHIDVFGRDDETIGTPEMVTLDGKELRVQSLTDQIRDKIDLMLRSDGLEAFDLQDLEHNQKAQDKYGYYAQKLLEIVDAAPGDIDVDKLPEGWRAALEVMASKGQYGVEASEEANAEYEEMKRQWAEVQAKIQEIKAQLMEELKTYYQELTSNNDGEAELKGLSADLLSNSENEVEKALTSSSNADEFITTLVTQLSASGVMDSINHRVKDMAKSATQAF